MPDDRKPDVAPLPAAQEDENVVFVEVGVAGEDGRAKPPGVAQGRFKVVGPVNVPPEPGSRAGAAVGGFGAFPLQVLDEGAIEREMTQVGFAVQFRSGVAIGIGGEGVGVPDDTPLRRLIPHDPEADVEGQGLHGVGTPSALPFRQSKPSASHDSAVWRSAVGAKGSGAGGSTATTSNRTTRL